MKYLNYITKEILNKLYITKKQSARFIAKQLKVNEKTILRYLKFYNIIARRTRFVKGKNNPFFGKYHSLKSKKLMSIKQSGKKLTKEHKLNIGKSVSGDKNGFFGKHHSPKTCKILSILNTGENHPNWKEGKSFEPYSPKWTEELKQSIRKRDDYKCQNCGMEQSEHFIVYGYDLNVHHIDYIKTNCTEENLISTCVSCNSRANYNRPYWQSFYTNKINLIYSNIKN